MQFPLEMGEDLLVEPMGFLIAELIGQLAHQQLMAKPVSERDAVIRWWGR